MENENEDEDHLNSIQTLKQENEQIAEQEEILWKNMSIRQKVNYLWSRLNYYREKYGAITGFIFLGLSIAAVVISSLMTNGLTFMKNSLKDVGEKLEKKLKDVGKKLKDVGKKLGNGLKDLGKKIASLLPAMIGSIVSYLFKTVGEVVGFISKNVWLIILAILVFILEQFKKKK